MGCRILRIILLLYFFACAIKSHGQKFIADGGVIKDAESTHFSRTLLPLKVDGLTPLLCDSFGISEVCLNVFHGELSDLKISLRSPSGVEVWLTNRNGEGENAFINTCFSSFSPNGFIFNSSNFNNTQFIPDGNLENFYDGTNPNGLWYLIVEDLKEQNFGSVKSFSITFEEKVSCINSICELENIQDCNCPDGKDTCTLLPDLVMLEKYTRDNISYFSGDDASYPNQIRFAAAMGNIGNGPLETVPIEEYFCDGLPVKNSGDCSEGKLSQALFQNIYLKQGESYSIKQVKANNWYFDDKRGHNHYHVEDWVDFLLLQKKWWTDNPKCWKVIAKSEKVSYCLMDSNYCLENEENCTIGQKVYSSKNIPNFGLGNYQMCDQNKQGISVGGIDNYGIFYEGQFISIPENIKPGNYYIYIVLDPENRYMESNEENNDILIPIEFAKVENGGLKLVTKSH